MSTGISYKTFRELVPMILTQRHPIIIRGPHGIGKSEVIYQIAQDIGYSVAGVDCNPRSDTYNAGVIERRASQMTEGDLVGLPKLCDEDGTTKFYTPDWLHQACERPVILFLDELDRAIKEVKQGFFELADSRKCFGKRLHPKTYIFAAINGGERGAQYQVLDMDPAEADRWVTFDLEPTLEDWLDWGKRKDYEGNLNILPIIAEFISDDPRHLEHSDEFEPGTIYPSRRSWKRLSDVLKNNMKLVKTASANLTHLATAYIGLHGAMAFADFCRNYEWKMSADDILVHNKWEKTLNFSASEHLALVNRIQNSDFYKNRCLDKKKLKNLATYFNILPSEIAMKFWSTTILIEDEKTFKKSSKFNERLHQCVDHNNLRVVDRLTQLATGFNPEKIDTMMGETSNGD